MKLLPTSFIYSLFLFWSLNVFGVSNSPIPVEANYYTTVTLFFPESILKVIEPASNFTFEYEENGNMATLKGEAGAPSNLTVITKEGHIYSFLLTYSKEVSNFTFVLSSEEAIGTISSAGKGRVSKAAKVSSWEKSIKEEPAVVEVQEETIRTEDPKGEQVLGVGEFISLQDEKGNEGEAFVASYPANAESKQELGSSHSKSGNLYEVDKLGYYSIFCENNYLQKTRFKKYGTSMNLIELQLNNIIADHEELYFVMEIQNNSWSDYQVKQLRFFVKTRELNTKLQVKELYTFNLPETITEHSVHNLVFVCKNFKLAPNQKVYAVLEEQDGRQRSVMLTLENEGINQR